jgi:hypothetical protein
METEQNSNDGSRLNGAVGSKFQKRNAVGTYRGDEL